MQAQSKILPQNECQSGPRILYDADMILSYMIYRKFVNVSSERRNINEFPIYHIREDHISIIEDTGSRLAFVLGENLRLGLHFTSPARCYGLLLHFRAFLSCYLD